MTHLEPSNFVKATRTYLEWCSVVLCNECKSLGHYADFHTVHPCLFCGSKDKTEIVGRWIKPKYKYFFIKKNNGYWEIKK